MAEVCTKCGEEARAKGSSWGKGCLAAAAKGRRMRRGDATGAASHVGVTQEVGLEPSLGWRGEVKRLRALVREKDEDIARLKRELAEANARAWPARGMGRPIPAAKPDNDKQVTPHGARCMCQWCQQQRRVAALEGA